MNCPICNGLVIRERCTMCGRDPLYLPEPVIIEEKVDNRPTWERLDYLYSQGKQCSKCGRPVTNDNKSGLCRKHYALYGNKRANVNSVKWVCS